MLMTGTWPPNVLLTLSIRAYSYSNLFKLDGISEYWAWWRDPIAIDREMMYVCTFAPNLLRWFSYVNASCIARFELGDDHLSSFLLNVFRNLNLLNPGAQAFEPRISGEMLCAKVVHGRIETFPGKLSGAWRAFR